VIEESIQTRAAPSKVWALWKQASYWEGSEGGFTQGQQGKAFNSQKKGAAFQILSIEEGASFTLQWRAPCLKIEVNHSVTPSDGGAKIRYQFVLRGFVAWPVEFLLKRRIRGHLKKALNEFNAILS
jgi:hypothetical protein